jgi:PAS domain S-box-containing protein
MIGIKDFSIKKKLISIQLLTAFIVLLFFGIFVVLYVQHLFRSSVISQLTSMAQLIGDNSISALNFLDNEVAEETLSSLATEDDIVNAWIYDADEDLFAKYSKAGYANFSFPKIEKESHQFSGNYITLSKRIFQDGNIIGMVSLRLDMKQFRHMVKQGIIAAFFVLIAGMIISLLLSILMQRTISNPILHLAEATKEVSETGNYFIRVKKEGEDEIGVLYDGFNTMLEQIHKCQLERDKVEAALWESEEKFRKGFESSNDAMMLLDEKEFFDCNRATLKVFGYATREEFCGKHPSEVSPPTQADRKDSRQAADEQIAVAFREGRNFFEWTHRRINGEDFPAEVLLTPVEIGGRKAIQATVRDISERKQAEDRIKEQAEFLNLVLESLTYPFYVVDVSDYSIKLANSAAHMGRLSKDLTCYALTHKSDRPCGSAEHLCPLEIVKKTKQAVTVEHTHYDKEGNPIDVEVNAFPVFDSEGNVSQIAEYALDITKRKRAEEELLKSEKKYRTLVDRMNDGLAVFDSTDLNVFVNDKFCQMLGYSRDEFSGHPASDFLDEANQRILEEHIARRRKGERDPYELEWTHKNGQKVFTLVSPTPILDADGRYAGAFAVITDITERRKRTHDLGERVKELNCLYGISKVVEQQDISLEEILQGIVNLIPASWQYPEITCARVILGDQVFVTDKFNESVWKQGGDIIVHGERAGALEVFYLEERPEIYEGPFLKEERNLIDAIAERLGKIIESKRTEEALGESEEKYRSLVESTEDCIYLVDENLRYLFANKKHQLRFGLPMDKIIGSKYGKFHSKEETKNFAEKVNNVFETAQSLSYEYRSKRDGRYFIRTLSPVKEPDKKVTVLTIISIDITERKRAEESLKQANEKLLEAHYQRKILSKRLIDLLEKERRQIAMEFHDHIGQTLTSCKIGLEIIHDRLEDSKSELRPQVKAIQEKTVQIMKDAKSISHGLRPGMIDTLGLVSSLRELFNEARQNTNMEVNFFSRRIPKHFDQRKELAIYRIAQEALTNVIRHARAKNVFVNLVKKDDKLSLSVEDYGVGFNQDKAMKITKGKGPLGLLIMRERAIQLDGEFTIESQPGKGTHVLVEIPL